MADPKTVPSSPRAPTRRPLQRRCTQPGISQFRVRLEVRTLEDEYCGPSGWLWDMES